jgi:hypothetical protein
MESFMIKYYCDMLIPNESCEVVSSVTEDLVHLFLTIRGVHERALLHIKIEMKQTTSEQIKCTCTQCNRQH